jgi:hypothetical protein
MSEDLYNFAFECSGCKASFMLVMRRGSHASGFKCSCGNLIPLNLNPEPPSPLLNAFKNLATERYISQFYRTEWPSAREAFDAGWNARNALEPPRAPPGLIEIGITQDETEVVINLPSMPDNGTGTVHYCFTPVQAFRAGETLIRKAGECK